MPIFRLAKEYGQSPEAVGQWSGKWFDKAWDIYIAENREKWPADELGGFEAHPNPTATTLLDHDRLFWMQFVVNGRVDGEKAQSAGYSPAQIPWIEDQMKSLGWLG